MENQRECGVLLPISSLPSKYGIGCFSKSAYEFVDQLIHLISLFPLLQEILILSVWKT